MNEEQERDLRFLEQVFIRAPYFSVAAYRAEGPAGALQDPGFRNALWLASPEFYGELEKLGFNFDGLDARKQAALRRYFNRACFRPTPFGAFASFSLASWSAGGRIRLDNGNQARLHLLPGRELQAAQEAREPLSPGCRLRLNPLLYRQGGDFRYIFSAKNGEKLAFGMNSLPGEELNIALIALLEHADLTCGVLAQFIMDRSGCSPAEAWAYLDFLVREQVVLTERDRDLVETGAGGQFPPWEAAFREKWAQVPFDAQLSLAGIAAALEQVAEPGPAVTPRAYFYSALERPVLSGGADPSDQALIREALWALQRLARPAPAALFREFMRAFKARFDRERVPLLRALDPDQGISYGKSLQEAAESLLDDVGFPDEGAAEQPADWTAVHELLLRCWLRGGGQGAFAPLVLTRADLAALPEPDDRKATCAPSLSVLYRKTGDRLWVESAGGVTAAALIGRFSVFSQSVHALCREIALAEQAANPDVVFAELSQLSGAHIDNVNRRRQIYDEVIPLGGFSGAPPAAQLPPADLLLSVHGEELVLESRRLGKRVIPRLPTAYNYHHNELPLFRFLGDLQAQYLRADLSFDPERWLPGLNFYPRVEFERVILSPARWKLEAAEVSALLAKPWSLGRLHLFRQHRHLPAQVTLGNGDQQLVFDLGDDAEAYFFLDCLKPGQAASLREYLPPDAGLTVAGRVHAAEYLGFLINPAEVYPALSGRSPLAVNEKRIFVMGSDWLFLKLFCTPGSSDQLLNEVIAPFVQHQPAIRSWFFIRYTEGGYHLRLRLRGEPGELAALLPVLEQALAAGHAGSLVRDLQADSYKRELERYSGELIGLAEECFAAGSDWVLYALGGLADRIPGLAPELAIFPLVRLMATEFFRDPQAESECYRSVAAGFLAMLSKGKSLRVDLDKKYRALKPQLDQVLNAGFLAEFAAAPSTQALLQTVRALALASEGRSTEKRRALIADLVHMQVNRVFRSRQLHYEAVIHYCLAKHGASARVLSGSRQVPGRPNG